MNTDDEIKHIRDFLLNSEASIFWTNSAIKWIRTGLSGNGYWLTNLKNPLVDISSQFGMITRFTVDCTINTEYGSREGKLIYTFGNGHKVEVK